MVLTQNQKQQLNKDILQYLSNNQYAKTAETFAEEAELALTDIDPEGRKLQIKYKSILSLQKKITTLQQKLLSTQEQLSKYNTGKCLANVNASQLYIPKLPPKYQLKGHKATITSMAFHPHFTQLATSSQDGTVKLWDFETGDFGGTLKGHTNPVNCVNYDSQGKYLVSSSSDLTIKLWDLNNDNQCCKTFYGHNHNVSFVMFYDSDMIISCSRDKTIKLWQISTGYCKKTFTGHQNWVRYLAISVDTKTFISCSDDQSIIVWNIDKESPVNRFFAHENVIQTVVLIEGENSNHLMNSEFLKHKFTNQSKINALKKLEEQGVNGISKYQKTFIVSGGRDKSIRLWLCPSGQHLFTFIGHDNWVRSLCFHPTGKYMYSVSDDKSLRIWDLNHGKQKKRIDAHEHFISSVIFNKKYGVISTSGNDLKIKIWHLK